MTEQLDDRIEFPSLRNGLDFILYALELLAGDPPAARSVKYAVLALSAGMELVLKERLHREHWSLVFEKIDSANHDAYLSGDFESVIYRTSIQRLRGVCKVKFSEDAIRRMDRLRKKRNQLEHFSFSDSRMAVIAAASSALAPLIDFIHDELLSAADEVDSSLFELIRTKLGSFDKFVQERSNEVKTDIDAATTAVVECPRCMQKSLILEEGARCAFCRYQEENEKAADTYISSVLGINYYETVKNGDTWPRYICPACGVETFVFNGVDYICFCCGVLFQYSSVEFCRECNRPYLPKPGESTEACISCLESWYDGIDNYG